MANPSNKRFGAILLAMLAVAGMARPAYGLNWGWDQDHTLYTFVKHFLGMDRQEKDFQGDPNESGIKSKVSDAGSPVAQSNPGTPGTKCPDDPLKACPFLIKSGKVQLPQVDLELPGNGPILSIRRVYNGTDPENGLLGSGWRFNFGKSIVKVRNTEGEDFLIVKDQSGQKYRLRKSGSGYATPEGYIKPTFILEDNSPGWKLTQIDGTVVLFDAMGNATSVTDAKGLEAILTYDAATGCPKEAKNASGNSLSFTIGPNGKIASIKDNLGRGVEYGYDAANNLITVGYWDKTTTAYAYDSSGQMLSQTDRSGRKAWSVTYGVDGRIATYSENGMNYTIFHGANFLQKTDARNSTQVFYYDERGVRTKLVVDGVAVEDRLPNPVNATAADWVQDGLAHRTLVGYDSRGNKTSETNALGHVKTWTYDGASRVTASLDENGVETKFAYDSKGNLATVRTAAGTAQEATVTYVHDEKGNLVSATDANGMIRTYAYDASGRRTKQTDPDGAVREWTYDSLGFPRSYKDPLAAIWNFHFDAMGNRLSEVNPLGDSSSWTYDGMGRVLSERDALGRVSTFAYDAFGRLATAIRPHRDSTFYRYDHNDHVTYVRKSGSRPILFQYTSRMLKSAQIVKMGDTSALADTSDLTTTYTYDNAGNLTLIVHPNGGRDVFAYDVMNRLVRRTNPLSEITQYAYDKASRDTLITLPNGRLVRNKYDAQGRAVEASDNLGVLARSQFDPMGNPLRVESPGSASALNSFDAMGRLVSTSDSSGVAMRYAYDAAGRMVESKDTLGNLSRTGYDVLGRKIWQHSALGDTLRFEYDAVGNLTALADADGNRTVFSFDSLSRPVKTVYPTGLTETTAYDSTGRLASRTDGRGITTSFAYDDAGRLLAKTYSDSTPAASFRYDKSGNLLSATNSAAALSWTRDLAGKPLTYTQTMDAKALTLKYAYVTATRSVQTTYPDSAIITRRYDFRDRLDSIKQATQLLVKYAYAQGALSKKTLGNSVEGAYAYDRDARLTGARFLKADTALLDLGMSYDGLGRKTGRKNGVDANGSETFAYDKTDQLIGYARGALDPDGSIPAPVDSRSWTLDSRGNWASVSVNGATETRTHNGLNELTGLGSEPFTYDAAGNLTQDTGRTYAWDAESRLVSAGGTTYLYDALGRRVGTRTADASVNYVFDGDREVFDDTLGGGRASIVHGNFIDEVISVKTNAVLWFALSDENFNIVEWRTAAGDVQGPIWYTPFGEAMYGAGGLTATELPAGMFGFQGKRWDFGAGAWNSRARMLNPQFGTFLSIDPKGFGGSDINLFRNVYNNPIGLVDPYGTDSWISNQIHLLTKKVMLSEKVYTPEKRGWHEYRTTPHLICSAAQGCTEAEMRQYAREFAVPGRDPSKPVESDRFYYAGDSEMHLPGGFVLTTISQDGLKVTNRTTWMHTLFDGQIERQIYKDENGNWFVSTLGTGNNHAGILEHGILGGPIRYIMSNLNEWQGPRIFNYVDRQMAEKIRLDRAPKSCPIKGDNDGK